MLLPVGPVTRKGEFPGDPPGLPVKGICRECRSGSRSAHGGLAKPVEPQIAKGY